MEPEAKLNPDPDTEPDADADLRSWILTWTQRCRPMLETETELEAKSGLDLARNSAVTL